MYKLTSGNMAIDLSYGDGKSRFVPIEHEEYKQWLSEGGIPEPEFTKVELRQQLKQEFMSAIQTLLDTTAQSKGYDSIISACSYAGYPNDFQEEAISFGVWRTDVWKNAYAIQADVESSTRPMPTLEKVLQELPAL